MNRNGKRLHACTHFVSHIVRKFKNAIFGKNTILCECAIPRKTDSCEFAAHEMNTFPAIMALTAVNQGVDGNTVTRLYPGNPFADFGYFAGEFMSEVYWTTLSSCQRMWF